MLESVKIDRESAAQAESSAKRIQRKEAELFAQMYPRNKHMANISELNEEIKRLENDMLFCEMKEARRREYANRHSSTVRARDIFAPPRSSNVFYSSTSRCDSERVLAHNEVRIDDILLERTVPAGDALKHLQRRKDVMTSFNNNNTNTNISGLLNPNSLTYSANNSLLSSVGSFPPGLALEGVLALGKKGHSAAPLPMGTATATAANKSSSTSNEPDVNFTKTATAAKASKMTVAASNKHRQLLARLGVAGVVGPNITAALAQSTRTAGRREAAEGEGEGVSASKGPQKLTTTTLRADAGARPTHGGESPFMLSVGRMRASTPAVLRRPATPLEGEGARVQTPTLLLATAQKVRRRAGGGGEGEVASSSSAAAPFRGDAVTEVLSTALVDRTRIDGAHISDSEEESEEGEGAGAGGKRTNGGDDNSSCGRSSAANRSLKKRSYAPSLSDINDRPWETKATHKGLIRDPYMRKYGLHRFSTYLYSDKMKEMLQDSTRIQKKISGGDGCDFEYRGNIKRDSVQRGNMPE